MAERRESEVIINIAILLIGLGVVASVIFFSQVADPGWSRCQLMGEEIRYLLMDNQSGYMGFDGKCYYNVPVRLASGYIVRVKVEAESFIDAVEESKAKR